MNKEHDLHSTEELYQFPCQFPIKVIGENNNELLTVVVKAINKQVSTAIDPTSIAQKLSKNGNYLSLTATITAESKAQLDAIYLAINASPLVKMTL